MTRLRTYKWASNEAADIVAVTKGIAGFGLVTDHLDIVSNRLEDMDAAYQKAVDLIDSLTRSLGEAVTDLEHTCTSRFDGWECTKEDLVAEHNAVWLKATRWLNGSA